MVDINLLPRKKTSVSRMVVVFSIIGVFWLLAAGYLGMLYVTGKKETASMQAEIERIEKQLSAMQQRQGQAVTVDDYLDLSNKLQHVFYPTTLLLDELASQLPEQGKVMSLSYNMDGKIEVEGRFEQYEDIAAYLYNVQQLPRVMKADVKRITIVKTEWIGPRDEKGNPLSLSLRLMGGKILPYYQARFEFITKTIDEKNFRKNTSPNKQSGATKQAGERE
ncbi:PilN domain-containing protein [Aneurinibacillus thermoaerophilus]|uniref:PilN domain-containing protein n=1 Tax=Aneurinibacillus thermoaerophilus TaxID=143495 RepID=UPI002E2220AE|nr:pilus assembly protein PilN [Aneurinibacillus thermoaerophilus]MED0736451.1 pilus assembly protein PilN [Aneurinibacillus thermoaerophilus]MED0763114.1 pilus assembly protein PilN [Aneurinibacillus thermoaerophilus]